MKTLSVRASNILGNIAGHAINPSALPPAETKAMVRRIVWSKDGETSDEVFERLRRYRLCGEKTALEIMKFAGFTRPRCRRKPTIASLKAENARLKKRIAALEQAAHVGHNP